MIIEIHFDEFIEKQNILISTVDILSERKNLDNLFIFFNKIYNNSGIEGTKANSIIYKSLFYFLNFLNI